MRHRISLIIIALLVIIVGVFFFADKINKEAELVLTPPEIEEDIQPEPKIEFSKPQNSSLITMPNHVFQTFNNCGPATLSMILAYYGINKTQAELGSQMRPYQNPRGDNDDKSLFSDEYIYWAKTFDLEGVVRSAGNIELLKTLVANGFPVVVRSWLRSGEDIGHYRIVRGFDESREVIIQNDSYFGKDIEIGYDQFLAMWQPFSYEYFVVYPPEKHELVSAILGEDAEEQYAWQQAYDLATTEMQANPQNLYPAFNRVKALFHLGRSEEAVIEFEKIETRLPSRMLWYQLEPIQAYAVMKEYEKVFSLTDKILSRDNRAFSELYLIRGELYLAQGNREAAKKEFELAVLYNKNLEAAVNALAELK